MIDDPNVNLDNIKLQLAFAAGTSLKSARTTEGVHARAFFQLQKLSDEHDNLGGEVAKRSKDVIKNSNRIRLSLHWDIVRSWTIEWPVPELRRALVQEMENADLSYHYAINMRGIKSETVRPTYDHDFLRKANGSLCAKLSLSHLVIREELGLEVLNQSPHVISLCFLHMTLSKFGAYERQGYGFKPNAQGGGHQRPIDPGSKPTLPDVERLCERHNQEYFGGDFPSDIERVIKQLQLKAGHSPMNFAAAAPGRAKQLKVSLKKNWEIHTGKETKLLRDLIHDRSSSLDTVYKFDKLMQEDEPHARKRKSYIQGKTIVDFLKKVQPKIQTAVDRLGFDYLTVHYAALALFKEIDNMLHQVGFRIKDDSGLSSIRPQTDKDWEEGDSKWWSYGLANAIIRELSMALSAEEDMRRDRVPMAEVSTIMVDVAASVLRNYGIEKGGRGFADIVKTPVFQ